MELSAPYPPEAILALGKRLVDELNLSDSVDTLGRWIAHHIAELIHQVEQATTEEQKRAAQQTCFETILKLWDHRTTVLHDERPLASLQSAIAMLNALNSGDENNLFWRRSTQGVQQPWANFVKNLRNAVDAIVSNALAGSVNQAMMAREKEWVDYHGVFLSEEERELISQVDAFLQGGRRFGSTIIVLEAEANELNAQEREALLISKIRQTLQAQLANLDKLHESLTGNGATTWEMDDVLEDDD